MAGYLGAARLRLEGAIDLGGVGDVRAATGQQPLGLPCDQRQCGFIGRNAFILTYLCKTADDLVHRDPAELMMLTAGKDGRRDLVDLGRREDEHRMGRGLFKRLQQCVEGCRG